MQPVLSIQGISKRYGSIQALNNVSFDVPKGCVFGILGPNGSGKTTMLSIILDILQANSGNYAWMGKPVLPKPGNRSAHCWKRQISITTSPPLITSILPKPSVVVVMQQILTGYWRL